MKKCTQLKVKAKSIFKNIDHKDRSGFIKAEIFMDVLDLIPMKLS